MKTAELTGALLDYWVARAEGWSIFAETWQNNKGVTVCDVEEWRPSMDWRQGGPLIEKYPMRIMAISSDFYEATLTAPGPTCFMRSEGSTPLQAICRAVVRAAFGDEVEEVAV